MTKQEQAEHECRPSAEQQQNRAAALWAGRRSKIAPGHGGCRKVLLQVILSVKGHRLHFLFKAHKKSSTLAGNKNENLMTTLSILKRHEIERGPAGCRSQKHEIISGPARGRCMHATVGDS